MTAGEMQTLQFVRNENHALCERVALLDGEIRAQAEHQLKMVSEHAALSAAYRLLEEEFSAYKRSVAERLEGYARAANDATEDAEVYYRAFQHLKQETGS